MTNINYIVSNINDFMNNITDIMNNTNDQISRDFLKFWMNKTALT